MASLLATSQNFRSYFIKAHRRLLTTKLGPKMPLSPPTTSTLEEFRALDCKGGSSILAHRLTPHIIKIQLNNPGRLNSLTGKMIVELYECILGIEAEAKDSDTELYGLVIEGVGGKSFCAGLDLDLAKDHFNTPDMGAKLSEFMQLIFTKIKALNLISVAVIEGYAFGGGAELTTATDFRFVSTNSKVRFVHRDIGTVPGWSGATRLNELLGPSRALYHLASTHPLDLPALGQGNDYFFKACAPGTTSVEAVEFLQSFTKHSANVRLACFGTRKVKELMEQVRMANTPSISLDIERAKFNELWGSSKNLESVQSAVDKKGKL